MRAKYLTLLLCIVVGLAIALASCGPQAAGTLTAALSELEGTVTMKLPGEEGFTQASPDKVLVQDGQVQTGEDGRVRLDLSSGTIIRMAPSSLFTLVSNEEVEGGLATQLQLEAGEIFVILNGGSMNVETPSGVASVRGSYMNVWVDPETLNVYVTCLEGSCHAGNDAGSVDFTDGEKTILFRRNDDGTYTVPEVEDMTEEDFEKWLNENPEAQEVWTQAVGTLTAMAPTKTNTPEPSNTPEPTNTPVPTDTPQPTPIPTKRELNKPTACDENPGGMECLCEVQNSELCCEYYYEEYEGCNLEQARTLPGSYPSLITYPYIVPVLVTYQYN